MFKSTVATAALLAVSQGAVAQQPPLGAGGQLQQIPRSPVAEKTAPNLVVETPVAPALPADEGPAILVNSLHVTGQTLFSETELIAATGFSPGATLSLADLRNAAAKISAYFHAKGYFLAQAYLPSQDIKAGVVTIAVIEGQYGKIDLNNQTNLSDRVARGVLSGLDSGDTVANAPLERRLLLLSDLPGVLVKSTLTPGGSVGTSDLIVQLRPGDRISGSVEADNAGNRYTGTYRAGGTLNVNNPAGLGDLLSLRVLGSSGELAYGRIAYQVPVGNITVGAAYARLRYDLGREFSGLDADGTADIATVYASYPLIRSRDANLYALASAEATWLKDDVGLVSSRSRKKSRAATIGLSGDSHDGFGGGGWNAVSAGLTLGELDIRSPLERAADALTARTDGGYGKLEYAAARLQTVGGSLSLYASIRGQIAFDNLDSSEKMELGGAYGVRAYPEGEAYGDEGYIATAEARLTVNQWTGKLPGQLQAIAFIDVGAVDYAHEPWFVGRNREKRSGFGGGLIWSGPAGLIVKASYAHKLGDAAVTSGPDRSGRFWFQVIKLF
jgi:hemolysin activation/secretion protein